MDIPKGFPELVKLVMKEPVTATKGTEIWEKFVQAILIGRGSDADIKMIIGFLEKEGLLKLDKVNKLSGSEWSVHVTKVLNRRLKSLKYEEDKAAVHNFLKELFRTTASIKGGARFFERMKVIDKIDELASDENASDFVKEISEDEDVAGVKYTKAILWLHSTGRAKSLVPPTRQVKSFINTDIGPYYPYYEDDAYFMKKAQELADELRKKVKGATAFDVSRAIFYYGSVKSMVPRGFGKSFKVSRFLELMKKKKLTIKKLAEILGSVEKRPKLMEDVDRFVRSL